MSTSEAGTPAKSNPPTFKAGSLLYSRRTLVALFGWLLWGDVCYTLMESVAPSILPLKFQSLGASNMVMGMVLGTIPSIFNVTITPWLSFKSDRHRSRRGRRLPFIVNTMPFLAGALVLIAFSDSLGAWVHGHFAAASEYRQTQVMVVVLAVFVALFNLFNMFLNTVYWYLFRDVVPETHMTRFNAWFRVVGTITSAGYNAFVFKYAETHMRWIFLGAACIYLFGFGLMCLFVKEGEYPPVTDVTEETSFLQKVGLYARECFTTRYYWDIFLFLTFQCIAGCVGLYGVFAAKSMGLTLDVIGKLGAVGVVTGPLCLLLLSGRVDRWHPVRIQAYALAYSAFFVFGGWIWLFVMTPNPVLYAWLVVADSVVFGALFAAASAASGAPLLMFLFPKDKYGQFSGALALIRAVALMGASVLVGLFMDFWKHLFPEGFYCYRFAFIWSGTCYIIAFYFFYRVYRTWKRMGGPAFVPPETNVRLADLPPRPDATSGLHPWMVRFTLISFVGGILGAVAWIVYYIHFEPRPDYVRIFLIAIGVNTLLYLAWLRFMKFMERP